MMKNLGESRTRAKGAGYRHGARPALGRGRSRVGAQNSPAENQYGSGEPPAASEPTPEAEPEIVPASDGCLVRAGRGGSEGLLPFTGAALIVPSVLGGLLLAGGLFLVYRTRRRET